MSCNAIMITKNMKHIRRRLFYLELFMEASETFNGGTVSRFILRSFTELVNYRPQIVSLYISLTTSNQLIQRIMEEYILGLLKLNLETHYDYINTLHHH